MDGRLRLVVKSEDLPLGSGYGEEKDNEGAKYDHEASHRLTSNSGIPPQERRELYLQLVALSTQSSTQSSSPHGSNHLAAHLRSLVRARLLR